MARPADCFDAVLRAMTADRSVTIKEAVRRLNDGCGYSAFKEWIRTNPQKKAQIDALRSAPAAETYFEAIAALIRAGATVNEACAARPEYPKPDTFLAWLRRRADLFANLKPFIDANNRARLKRQKPRLGDRKYSPADLDRALAVIRASDAGDLRTVLVPPLPAYSVLQMYAKRDPEFVRRFREAIDARPNPNRVRPDDIERALEAIRTNPDKPIAAVLGPANNLPSYPTLQKLAGEDTAFAARLDAIVTRKFTDRGMRPKGRKVPPESYARAIEALKSGRYRSAASFLRSDPTMPTLSGLWAYARRHAETLDQYRAVMGERRPKAAPKPVYTHGNFQRQLRATELYRNARALLRVSSSEHRDDVLQDIIVKMLEGASAEDIRREHKSIVRDHFSRTRFVGASTDEPVFDGEHTAYIDTVPTHSEAIIW